MKEVFREYYPTLNEAREVRNKKSDELLKQPFYFDCSVWQDGDSRVFKNGEWCGYVVIACLWENFKVR